jgi:hypothetical protein
MRANLLASVASAAVATFLAIGTVQAQSDDDQLKRKQNAPAAQSESQPAQDEGAARPAGREAAGAADEQSGSMKKRKATSAEADDAEGAPDGKPTTAASDEGAMKKKRNAAAEGSDDADAQRKRKATTAESGDADMQKKRDSTAEADDADVMKKRKSTTADTDDMDDATRRKTTAESADEGDLKKKRNARSETETDESGTRREQASSRRSSGDVEVTGSINIDRDKASRVHDRLVRRASRTNVDVDIDISVGSTLPDRVVLQRVPDEIIEISPEFRGYEYTVVRDEIIIVEPRTKKVVEVIRKGGGKSASSKSGRSKLKLTAAQRERIRSVVREQRITRLDLDVDLGSDVPETVELAPLPDVVFTDVPELREYEYFVTNEEIVLVEPDTREVVEVIR